MLATPGKIAMTRRAQVERVLAPIALYSQPSERTGTRAGYWMR
jgi:hypothetical protein